MVSVLKDWWLTIAMVVTIIIFGIPQVFMWLFN